MHYELTDLKTVKSILSQNGIVLTKARGQNFLINPSVCPRMAELCGATKADGVLEIGPGIGVLTKELAKVAGKVVSVEVDNGLLPVLAQTLADYDNVEIVSGDILKCNLPELIKEKFGDKKVFICANLPYYITTPILMGLLESGLSFAGITVMVQKEFATRLCAKVGSRESGAVTVAAAFYAKCEVAFGVSRGSFFPAPNVDSAVMQLTPYDTPPVEVKDTALFFRMVRAGFNQRRKTLTNSLSVGLNLTKEQVQTALEAVGLKPTARAEELTLEQLATLSEELGKIS